MRIAIIIPWRWTTALVVHAVCGAVPSIAAANELPRSFDFSVTFTWTQESTKTITLGDKNSIVSVRHSITANSDSPNPFLKVMVADCTHQVANVAGKFEQLGACNFEDAAGDQLYEVYRGTEPGKGTITFIGGTGKCAGIRCEGNYAAIGFARKGMSGVGTKKGKCSFAP